MRAGCFEGFNLELTMSRTALFFLISAVISGVLGLFQTPGEEEILPLVACGIFCVLFVGAMLIGRRIKFDPVLRCH